ASWVGLGFSLNAGGVISRRIMGLADDFNTVPGKTGYFYNYPTVGAHPTNPSVLLLDNNYNLGLPFSQYQDATNHGLYDYLPDIFSFNFAGHSGMFTLQPQNGQPNNLKAIMFPYK